MRTPDPVAMTSLLGSPAPTPVPAPRSAYWLFYREVASAQLAGYRLLADATVPYVDGETFADAAAYTETNAAFHEYLFSLTGNEHLLQAYRALGRLDGHGSLGLGRASAPVRFHGYSADQCLVEVRGQVNCARQG